MIYLIMKKRPLTNMEVTSGDLLETINKKHRTQNWSSIGKTNGTIKLFRNFHFDKFALACFPGLQTITIVLQINN